MGDKTTGHVLPAASGKYIYMLTGQCRPLAAQRLAALALGATRVLGIMHVELVGHTHTHTQALNSGLAYLCRVWQMNPRGWCPLSVPLSAKRGSRKMDTPISTHQEPFFGQYLVTWD